MRKFHVSKSALTAVAVVGVGLLVSTVGVVRAAVTWGTSEPASFATDEGDDGAVVLKWQFQQTFKPGEGGFVRFRTIVR